MRVSLTDSVFPSDHNGKDGRTMPTVGPALLGKEKKGSSEVKTEPGKKVKAGREREGKLPRRGPWWGLAHAGPQGPFHRILTQPDNSVGTFCLSVYQYV